MAAGSPNLIASMASSASASAQSTRFDAFPHPPTDLIDSDGEPLESHWHVNEINLLCDVIRNRLQIQNRDDCYAAGNMFIYFDREQARNLHYRGPDFFFVNGGVSRTPMRPYWAIWDENGRYPDVIIELMSKTTRTGDLTIKKEIYEKTFKTREYFCYDPDTYELLGWRLSGTYKTIKPDQRGRLWSEQLGLWLGLWQGEYIGYNSQWLRFFDVQGNLVPSFGEAARQDADTLRQQADALQKRADALVAELAQLRVRVDADERVPASANE